jgi:hypothetical protein
VRRELLPAEPDVRGNLRAWTDAAGVLHGRVYDCADRPLTETAGADVIATLSYDGEGYKGRLTDSTYVNMGGEEVSRHYEYDGRMGRLSSQTTFALGYRFDQLIEYNDLGLVDEVTYPASNNPADPSQSQDRDEQLGLRQVLALTHSYERGFFWKLLRSGTTQSYVSVDTGLGYDPGGGIRQLEFLGSQQDWEFDARNRIERITGTLGGVTVLDTGTYAYDPSGNITAMGSDTFDYYGGGQLAAGTVSAGAWPAE